MTIKVKASVVAATLVLMSGVLAYAAPAMAESSAVRTSVKEGVSAIGAQNFAQSEDIFKRLLDGNACASEGDLEHVCQFWIRYGLAMSYDKQGKKEKALPLYMKVADSPVPVAKVQYITMEGDPYKVNHRKAAMCAGEMLQREKRYDEAFRYFMVAHDDVPANLFERMFIDAGIAATAKGKKNLKLAAARLKPDYYAHPLSQPIRAGYESVAGSLGDKAELRNIRDFQDIIYPRISGWETKYRPANRSDEASLARYNRRLATVYRHALEATKSLGLTGYDRFLTDLARYFQQEADSAEAKLREKAERERMQAEYERQVAEERRRRDAEDAAIMNMFMNILTAPRY